ncbi:hypothetical protein M8J75_012448 [Diaphorina citri]|nr:hypothetical protein M8J75_012448 [Diaphorina citri]
MSYGNELVPDTPGNACMQDTLYRFDRTGDFQARTPKSLRNAPAGVVFKVAVTRQPLSFIFSACMFSL